MSKASFQRAIPFALMALVGFASCSTPSTLRIPDAQLIENDSDNIVSETELAVIVENKMTATSLIYKATQLQYSVVRQEELNGLRLHLIVFKIPVGMDGVKAIGELEALEANTIAGVNHAYTLQATSNNVDPSSDTYANHIMKWPSNGCQTQTAIGVIDAKMDENLAQSYGARLIQKNFSINNPQGSETVSHGNKVLAVFAGDGRLHNPTIFNASVVSDTDTGEAGVTNIIQALNWLMENNVKIINISLAGPYNKILDKAIRNADRNGAMIIAAAGNNGPNSPPRYPAAFPEVLAVTAVDADNKVFKNAVRGEHIDFAAPGVDVKIKVGDKFGFVTGTSFASPFLTSMLATNPTLLEDLDAPETLSAKGIEFEDLGPIGFDDTYGHGLLKFSWDCAG